MKAFQGTRYNAATTGAPFGTTFFNTLIHEPKPFFGWSGSGGGFCKIGCNGQRLGQQTNATFLPHYSQ